MDPGHIFQIITNSTLLATRLLSGSGVGPLEFSESRYCAVLPEDAHLAATVLTVNATHRNGQAVRYSITGGNKDGLFTIDQHSGVITLAAALDYEIQDKHELVVAAEGGGHTVHAMVQVRVSDVNDNPPYFLNPQPHLTVVEEDDRHLPATIAKVEAQDADRLDHHGLLYTVRGDGVDGYDPSDAFFTINSLTGELIQRRAVDRDPPRGKGVWRVRVQVRDGQALWSRQAMDRHLAKISKTQEGDRKRRRSGGQGYKGDWFSTQEMTRRDIDRRHGRVEVAEDQSTGKTEEGYLQGRLPPASVVREDKQTKTNSGHRAITFSVKGVTELSNTSRYSDKDQWKYGSKITKPRTGRDKPEIMEGHGTVQRGMLYEVDNHENFVNTESRHTMKHGRVKTKESVSRSEVSHYLK
ncbi:putative neural-cadherin 2 isoform X2 [Panulirus ornatus]|uniref:putative neural-cadherin 2 isoform X2 n=1 Tax=Panulirus ornatus TaxID=150431 RepID=UPI003A859A49